MNIKYNVNCNYISAQSITSLMSPYSLLIHDHIKYEFFAPFKKLVIKIILSCAIDQVPSLVLPAYNKGSFHLYKDKLVELRVYKQSLHLFCFSY